MATNNSTNLSTSNLTYYDGVNSYTGINLNTDNLLVGLSSSSPIALNMMMLAGLNCWFWNLSFTHSSGTLTIAGADGTALSSNNPAYLVMPSNATIGRLAQFKITSNQTLTVSDMTGNIGNMTASTAYSNSFPLYIGFMADSSDENLVGVVTWVPNCRISPSTSTNIGDPSAANADLQYSVFSFDDITESNYTSKNIGLIGSLTATKNSSDAYTLDSLNNQYDGIGKWNDNRYFTFSGGLFGNAANSYFLSNGGTAPVFTGDVMLYNLFSDGKIVLTYASGKTSTTVGAGAVRALLAMPFEFIIDTNFTDFICGFGRSQTTSLGAGYHCAYFLPGTSTRNVSIKDYQANSGMQLVDFNTSGDYIDLRVYGYVRGIE